MIKSSVRNKFMKPSTITDAVFTVIGGALGALFLYVMPSSHNWTDAKIAIPIGAVLGCVLGRLVCKLIG
jgi:glycopeptide antibiotics resistance protein